MSEQEQEKTWPRVLRVSKDAFVHGMLAGTFDLSKLADYTHYVGDTVQDYENSAYRHLEDFETCENIMLEYENPNGTLDLEISFELTCEFILFFSHEAYMAIQRADGWFRLSQKCPFRENPCFFKSKY